MGRVVSNDVSAIIPELWSESLQIPLYKTLVGMGVANMDLRESVKHMDTIRKSYFGSLSAQTYTPGTPLSATNLDHTMDTLVVSAFKHATFYIDDVHQLQQNLTGIREYTEDAAYQLGNAIDTHILKNITGSDGFTNFGVDAAGLQGGTAHRPVSAGSAAIINIFANARKLLRQANVEEYGDWISIVTPLIAYYIETKAATVGFNVADSTLRNGYAGDFMGFKVYISNNLPSGKCSAIAATISGAAVSATSCKAIHFGRKGMIDVVMQKAPTLQITKCEDKLGSNFITWTVYGSAIFTRNRSRGLNVAVQSGYY